jgi:Protein of unknown function, DUF481
LIGSIDGHTRGLLENTSHEGLIAILSCSEIGLLILYRGRKRQKIRVFISNYEIRLYYLKLFGPRAAAILLGVLLSIVFSVFALPAVALEVWESEMFAIRRLPPVDLSSPVELKGPAEASEPESLKPSEESEKSEPESVDPKSSDSGGILPSGIVERFESIESVPAGYVERVEDRIHMPRQLGQAADYLDPWDGSVELGMDGSSGSANTMSIRFGVESKLKMEKNIFSIDLDYHKASTDGQKNTNRLYFDWRYEKPEVAGPFYWYVNGTTTYDEFQPWKVQVSSSTGLGLTFIDTGRFSFGGRFGGGFSQDIGGPDQSVKPELHWGFDSVWKITNRQKFVTSLDYYPDVTQLNYFRNVFKFSWEILLDEEMNLSMKFNTTDRFYRPNPGGVPNDVDYSVVLLWGF